jgi:trans-aconitate 2-methyltransferase
MWSPTQYRRFKQERRQPFDDLLALVERRPHMRVVDLGCGPGELTRELHDTLAAAETLGIDNSPSMLVEARKHEGGGLRFEAGEIEDFECGARYDLVFSNAAFHWVPDHERLFARLVRCLGIGGQLSVQMPANDHHASHAVAAEVAREMGVEPRPSPILPLTSYAELLYRLGFKRQHVRAQMYGHVLPSSADVVEWVRGALLTHYEAQLPADRFEEFMHAYRERLQGAIGVHEPYFYTYQRILMHGSL